MKQYKLKQQQVCLDNFKIDYQNELNKEQLDVVLNGEGPCLVLAGAGSGKTRTLVYRVAYLVEKGIDPKNILLVTFTNKAAKEMLNRVEVLLKCQPKGLWGGTFHHIGNIILRRYAKNLGYDNKFTILDQEDSKTLLKAVMGELNLNYKDKYFPKADVIQNIISFSQNSQKPISEVIELKYSYLDPKLILVIETINKAYQKKKLKTNVMDFDDLLINWLKLLKKDKTVKKRLANQFKYILVDEYQDTNKIQSEIIKELGAAHNNVLVVGDDCQSIYSFRAADINNILSFPKNFKGAKIFKIETNYRSSPEILNLANESIANNLNQYQKALNTIIDHKQKPALVALRDGEQQAHFVCQRILELQEEGISLKDMAVLFRSSFQALEMELELNKRNIPYQMRGGIKFFEQAHIKDVVAYLKIINNWQDELSWKRVLLLYEGIGPANAQIIWQEISKLASIKSAAEQLVRIPAGFKVLRSLEKLNGLLKFLLETHEDFIASSIRQILKADYEDYLKANFENAKDRLEDLNQLANFALQYEKLEDFLSDVTLSEGFKGESVEGYKEGPDEALILSTIHQAKGLEWKYLFVIGLVEGQFPHYKIYDHPEEIEEERRLFYVAVTRAKDELYLTYPIISFSFTTGQNINKPSQFIAELDDSLFEPWQVDENGENYEDDEDEDEDIIDFDKSHPKRPRGAKKLRKHEFLSSVTYEDLDDGY
ncbi:MAG TPA: ATP-dependent helicase [Candidatus Uhrbacteria bacterium]|nr:ATP-dependent helicase [Candidatus Uhrbacteria bacterium]